MFSRSVLSVSIDLLSISHFLNKMSNLSEVYWLVKTTDSVCDFSCRALRRGSDAQCVLTAVQHVYQCHIWKPTQGEPPVNFSTPSEGINKHCSAVLPFGGCDKCTLSVNLYPQSSRWSVVFSWPAATSGCSQKKKYSIQFCSIFLIPSSRGDAPHLENHRQRHIFPLYTNQFSLRSVFFCMCPTDTLTPEWRGCRVAGKRDWSGVTFLYANLYRMDTHTHDSSSVRDESKDIIKTQILLLMSVCVCLLACFFPPWITPPPTILCVNQSLSL